MNYFSDVDTPLGLIRVVADESAMLAVGFYPERNRKLARLKLTGEEGSNELTSKAAIQIEEYFAGERKVFELSVSFGKQTPFAQDILNCLSDHFLLQRLNDKYNLTTIICHPRFDALKRLHRRAKNQ